MENITIFPFETPLVRVDAVDAGLNGPVLLGVNSTIRSHNFVLSSERISQAGYQ